MAQSLVLQPQLEESARSCQVGCKPGVHGTHLSLSWLPAFQARPSPAGRLKLLEPEVLECIDVVEIGKDPGTRGVSFQIGDCENKKEQCVAYLLGREEEENSGKNIILGYFLWILKILVRKCFLGYNRMLRWARWCFES